ncbi:MAG: hypothetical protein LDL07_10775, partial [Desulfarculus sp.]|nr:hypothetical protein [Desulfarculus sp.]
MPTTSAQTPKLPEGFVWEAPPQPPQAAPPTTSAQTQEGLPPDVMEIEGVYFRRMPGGSLLPVGEKGLVQPMYDPVDLIADAATGGISGAARLAGRTVLKSGVLGLATREGLGNLVRQGFSPVASAVVQGAARDAGFGALAGGTMEAVEHGTGNQLGAALAGIGAPVAAAVGPMVVRRGLAKLVDNASESVGRAVANAADNPGWQASQSKLAQRFGTLSEAIGSEAYGAVARAEASQALDATRIAAETGEYTLRPWVQNVMRGIPWLRDDRALIIGQGLRDLVNRIPGVGEALAGRLGLTNADLHQLTRLAEVIPAQPLDWSGNLRLGIKDWVKDADGASKQVWRHGLTPEAAREEVASLKPAAQKLLMAYVEPSEGFHLPPRLAPVGQVPGEGVDLGQWSLEQLAARTRMTPEALASNYAIWGPNAFLAGFGSGDDASRVLASRALKHIEENPSRYLKVFTYQEPDAAMDGGLGRIVAEGLAPMRPGKVGLINDQVAQEINQLGFSTGPSAVMLTSDKLPHLKQRHGGQLTAQDWRQVQRTIEEPQEVLPNLATAQSPERSRSVLLVRQEGKSYVSIVEITAGDEANQLWNFWKMSPKKADNYLRKFREEKARRLQPGGAASSPIFLPSAQRLEGGKPEGLSGSQTAATSLDSMLVGSAGEVKPGPGKKALDQAADQAGDLVRYQEPGTQALAESVAVPGPFGPVFTGFVNRPDDAIAHLMKLRTGEAVGALSRPETGAVDLVWGEGGPRGFGLAHILEKHGEEVVREIPRIFASGEVIQVPKRPGRLYVETPGHMAVIRLDWDGQEKRWLVTAYDKKAPHPNRTSSLV